MNVIVLDDSQTIQMIIGAHLEELEISDDEISSFDNGHEALAFIKENGAELIFCDINMPKMNGYEFAKSLFEFRPDLVKSFFVVSGEESGASIQKMKDAGAKRFLKKPIKENQFNHFIQQEIKKIRLSE